MELHHSKHHQTYVTNLNKALSAEATFTSLTSIPQRIANQAAVRFNGGGHINHSLFWENLTPVGSPATDVAKSAPKLLKAIESQYGGLDKFKEKFNTALLGIQGSGWGWLVKSVEGEVRLQIVTTKDQDPVTADVVPIFGEWSADVHMANARLTCFRRRYVGARLLSAIPERQAWLC
jgi:Fe-Mn family superoxide dismutase